MAASLVAVVVLVVLVALAAAAAVVVAVAVAVAVVPRVWLEEWLRLRDHRLVEAAAAAATVRQRQFQRPPRAKCRRRRL